MSSPLSKTEATPGFSPDWGPRRGFSKALFQICLLCSYPSQVGFPETSNPLRNTLSLSAKLRESLYELSSQKTSVLTLLIAFPSSQGSYSTFLLN